jgi:protein STE50
MASDNVGGDTFAILSHARGWWVVQRDPAGTGTVEIDTSKQRWAPAGCLLETRVPMASAIAEASGVTDATATQNYSMPIIPLSIVSAFTPGVALADYTRKGE